MTTPSTAPVPSAVSGTAVPTNSAVQTQMIRQVASAITQAAVGGTAADPSSAISGFGKGVVTAYNPNVGPRTVTITLNGSTTPIPGVTYLDSYSPNVGDVVVVATINEQQFVLGQLDADSTGTFAGWQLAEPLLQSGYTSNGDGNGDLKYRLVIDNGARKVQWQGSIAIGSPGSNTVLTVPADYFNPGGTRNTLLAARDQGQLNGLQVDFNTDGTVELWGTQSMPSLSGGGATTSQSGTTSGGHSHSVTVTGSEGFSGTDSGGFTYSGSASGSESGSSDNQTVTIGHNHTVSMPTLSVNAPTFVSFNGLEYFIDS